MAGKKVFFSIKNKIVLTLVVLLICVTGFNLIYSYKTFKNDKERYIFENSLRSSELANKNILECIKRQSELLAATSKVKSEQFYLTGNLLSTDESFHFIYNDNSFEIYEERIKKIVRQEAKQFKSEIKISPFEKHLLLMLKLENGIRFALVSKEVLTEPMARDSLFAYIVTDKAKNIYYGEKSLTPGFLSIVKADVLQSSQITNVNNKAYLASYSQIKQLGLITFSYVSEEKAFALFKDILFQSISFSVVILGFFLVVAVLFSSKITTPILQIIDKTKEIAEGNFEGTVEVSTRDELQVLGSSVNNMSSQIMKLLGDKQEMIKELEIANTMLDEYNENLEAVVAERTKELQEANNFITAMINSLDQGLFVFDKSKQCLDIFTKACEKLFNKVPTGLEVSKLLDLTQNQVEAFEKWANIIFSNMMPFDAAKNLGPKSVTHSNYGEADFQHIELEYYPMNDEEGNLQNIVAVATDKTSEIEAEERFKEKDAYVTMILNIIKNKKAFYDFIDEMDAMLTNLADFSKHEDLSNIAMIAFHSMNGGYANYSIKHLVTVARDCESQIKSFSGDRGELESLIEHLIDTFKTEQQKILAEIEEQLAASKDKVEIDKSDLAELKAKVEAGEDAKALFHEYFEKDKVSSIFSPYAELVKQISVQINKPMMPLIITGGDIRVDTNKIKEFSSSLVHLFRNSMDHGIEATEQRLAEGKPKEGVISITCSMQDNHMLRIVIQDDGGGIHVKKIREVLEKKGIDHSGLNDKDAMMYIFQPDFSTAEELTELSGRGVGMSAIAQAIKNLHGRLDLRSEEGKGSKFIFELPV